MMGQNRDQMFRLPGYSAHLLATSSLYLPAELDVSSAFNSTFFQESTCLEDNNEDVVVLAEFSEIEGPVPLVTIPDIIELNFDISNFIVKLMSVDYQNISAGEFEICADTQLMQFNIDKGYHAYVHYFTLYDERARGFVRPMCLVYISCNDRKLQKHFSNIQKEFKITSDYLKSCNLLKFKEDMKKRVFDLHYTKHRFIIANRHIQQDPPLMPNPPKQIRKFSIQDISDPVLKDVSLSPRRRSIPSQLNEGLVMIQKKNEAQSIIHSFTLSEESIESNCDSESSHQSMKIPIRVTTGKIGLVSLEEELALLKHTSLEAIAYQLLDCQHILGVIDKQIEKDTMTNYLDTLADDLSSTNGLLADALKTLNISHKHHSLEDHKPSVFVVSAMKRTFSDMRSIEDISDIGYVACLRKLIEIYDKYSRPLLNLFIQDMDSPYMKDPMISLFVGDCPVAGIHQFKENAQNSISTDRDSAEREKMLVALLYRNFKFNDQTIDNLNKQSLLNLPKLHAKTAGGHLSTLLHQYHGAAHCMVHSLLSGRFLILAAPQDRQSIVQSYIDTLAQFLPHSNTGQTPVLKWHTGTVTEHHLKKYKLMGLCIPERLHVQDLMSNHTLNQVTVLNVSNGHISGIAYSGQFLQIVDQLNSRHFHHDETMKTCLQAILLFIGLKVYLVYFLLNTTSRSKGQILKGLGIYGRDQTIITHLINELQKKVC